MRKYGKTGLVLMSVIVFVLSVCGCENTEMCKVACVGDSITQGTTRYDYPEKLGRLLGNGFSVRNFGVSGTTAMTDSRSSYRDTEEYQEGIDFLPDIVVLMFGTNDTNVATWQNREVFRDQYEELVLSYIKLESRPRVYLCTPAAAYYTNGKTDGAMEYGIQGSLYEEVIDVIEETAEKYGLDIIDIQSWTSGHQEWYNPDGIHPNEEGAQQIAEAVYQRIKEDAK